MLDSFEGFWRGTTKPLRIASVGFAVAAVGAVLGFAVSTGQPTLLFLFAFGVTACGVVIGGIGVVWGMVLFFQRQAVSRLISNPTLKFAPFGRWDAPSARPLASR